MTLAKYIHDLLFRYECVIVPQFGGFLTQTKSAHIDEKTHTLYPPAKRLSFNSQLVENDGLLVNYIASVEKISYEKASEFVNSEVASLKSQLQDNKKINFKGIGDFTLNSEDKLVFNPDENANFLTDSFGLTPIVAPEVSRENIEEEEVIFDSISDIISDKDIAINTEMHRETNYKSLLAYAAIFAVLAVVGYFIVITIIHNNKALKLKTAEVEATKENMLNKRIQEATFEINKTLPAITLKVSEQADSLQVETPAGADTELASAGEDKDTEPEANTGLTPDKEAENSGSQTTETEAVVSTGTENTAATENSASGNANTKSGNTKVVENTAENTETATVNNTPEVNTSYRYHIIAGAFREPANARRKVKQLIRKGYDAHIVGVNKWQLTQVAFGSYATRTEAQKNLKIIKKTAKDAWLLVK